ncbi:MAG: tetratricopeptide repeat protein [Thermoanaerobaculales bacterium]|jgi:Flp pilus assembly protein TadD|nr:tetratricopeptide repeat protein [Thermoanaerobaculales bacterium]
MKRISLLIILVLASAAVAAAGGAGNAFDYDAWRNEVAALGLDPDEVVYPFHATPQMRAWAEQAVGPVGSSESSLRLANLQRAFFDEGAFEFSYDDARTLTAERAFAERRGNCLSFTSLFIAMSRSLGIPTYLMAVTRDPVVDRDGGLVVVNHHVVAAHGSGPQVAMFDFSFLSEAPVVGRSVLDDVRASALHHNNLGANALREGLLGPAGRHFGTATRLAPEWPAGWVNLGVFRVRAGDVDGAFEAYRRALAINPQYSSALNNLSILYGNLGRHDEARVALLAAAQRGASPFTLITLADSEMARGDLRSAEGYLKRAKRRFPREPEVWDGLARYAARTGDEKRQQRYLRKARTLREKEVAAAANDD